MAGPRLSVVCPFYNEQASVALFFDRLIPILEAAGESFEILCVNDGSDDATLQALLDAQNRYPNVRIIDLSRNFGKEAALSAALEFARGDAIIPIDADLQDPPEIIPTMIEKWKLGYAQVLAKRSNRDADAWSKRTSASVFYWLHNRLADTQLPENVGDFRLMDRTVVEAIKQLPERTRFMKGLFSWVGFRTTTIEYVREQRQTGRSKFGNWRLWNLALEAFTSFSTVPLRMCTYIGLLVAIVSFIIGLKVILRTLIYGIELPGYASLMTVVLFLGGIQLIAIGVVGEYLGRLFNEAKGRPLYIVQRTYESPEQRAE
jgi:glycosyltransferase involved in cell wall biosynthesis